MPGSSVALSVLRMLVTATAQRAGGCGHQRHRPRLVSADRRRLRGQSVPERGDRRCRSRTSAAASTSFPRSGFVVGAEYTTAWFEREQTGRLVLGGFPPTIPRDDAAARLDAQLPGSDTRHRVRRHTARLLWRCRRAPRSHRRSTASRSSNHDNDESALPLRADRRRRRAAPAVASRVAVRDRRPLHLHRAPKQNIRYLGIGPHVLRVGGGVRVRLN